MTDSHDETVPRRMNDPTDKEKLYYKENGLWGADVYYDLCCWRGLLISPIGFVLPTLLTSILGVSVLLSRSETRISIAMVPTAATIRLAIYIMSTILVIVCVVTLLGGIALFLFFRFSGAQPESVHRKRLLLILSVFFFFHFVLFTCDITAAALIPKFSVTPTQLSFNKYLGNQSVQQYFDNVQHNLQCFGVVAFTDYESIFNNLSVPVSCCNTTNPLANETTCPEIVSNAQQANQTGLIYSEGCAPWLQPILQSIVVIAVCSGVMNFVIGGTQTLCNYTLFVFFCSARNRY